MTYAMQRRPGKQHLAREYATIGLETQVLSAGREQLITLLFDGAQMAISKAMLHMQNNNIPERGAAISKAIDIVDSGLKASVDQEAGGELATHLIAIYELIIRHLLLANLNADSEKLSLALRLLTDIGDAWRIATDPSKRAIPAR